MLPTPVMEVEVWGREGFTPKKRPSLLQVDKHNDIIHLKGSPSEAVARLAVSDGPHHQLLR